MLITLYGISTVQSQRQPCIYSVHFYISLMAVHSRSTVNMIKLAVFVVEVKTAKLMTNKIQTIDQTSPEMLISCLYIVYFFPLHPSPHSSEWFDKLALAALVAALGTTH